MPASTRVYAGRTAGERRASRREQLLEAALDLAGDGWETATVRAVCARAGLTTRYFYESFSDREALLLALFDEIAAEALARGMAAIETAPDDAVAKGRAAIGSLVDLLAEDPRKGRILFTEAAGLAALLERRQQALALLTEVIATQGRRFYGVPEGRDRTVQTTALLLAGGLSEILRAWQDGRLDAGRERLVEDCAQLFAAVGETAMRLTAPTSSG